MVYCVVLGMNCSCICIVSLRLSGVLCGARYELQLYMYSKPETEWCTVCWQV